MFQALAGVAQLIECGPANQRVANLRSSLADTRGVGLAMWVSFFWLEETLSLCPQIPGGVSLRAESGREPLGQKSWGGEEYQIVGP